MPSRDGRSAATTVEVALALDDLTLEPDERAAALVANPALLSFDDTAEFRGVEDVSRERRVGGDRLDTVDDVREREFVRFEVGEEFEREFDAFLTWLFGHESGGSRRASG